MFVFKTRLIFYELDDFVSSSVGFYISFKTLKDTPGVSSGLVAFPCVVGNGLLIC